MDKIAVMVCEKLSRECTGAGCFDAFAERRDAFARYCSYGFVYQN